MPVTETEDKAVCPWHAAHGVRTIQFVSTSFLISTCVPGNRPPPWSWKDEAAYVDSQACCCEGCPCDRSGDVGWYQRGIEAHMRAAGCWIGPPAMVGADKIVRDGHHRIIAAWRVGLPEIQTVRADWPLWWQERGDR